MTESIERRKVSGIGENNIVARQFPTLAQAAQVYQEIRSMQSATNGSQVT